MVNILVCLVIWWCGWLFVLVISMVLIFGLVCSMEGVMGLVGRIFVIGGMRLDLVRDFGFVLFGLGVCCLCWVFFVSLWCCLGVRVW